MEVDSTIITQTSRTRLPPGRRRKSLKSPPPNLRTSAKLLILFCRVSHHSHSIGTNFPAYTEGGVLDVGRLACYTVVILPREYNMKLTSFFLTIPISTFLITATPAAALDKIFSGTWAIVGPETHEMLGARLRFSNRTKDSAYVQVNQMSGLLRRSDGRGGSNYVVRTEAFDCYYDVVILTGREEMTWRLTNSGGAPCVGSFRARLDP